LADFFTLAVSLHAGKSTARVVKFRGEIRKCPSRATHCDDYKKRSLREQSPPLLFHAKSKWLAAVGGEFEHRVATSIA
jgi:hypothetical protein